MTAAAQPASDDGAQVNQWLHGFVEIAKICVIFAGGYFSHWLLLCRDVSGRKKAFNGFLRQWRAEISAPYLGPTSLRVGIDSSIFSYFSKLPSFCSEIERVRSDFAGDAERFESLTSRLSSLKAEDWKGKQPREVILYALDELIQFAV